MLDKEIATMFGQLLLPAMQADPAMYGVALVRNYQQTQQGATVGPCVYFEKIADRRYGHIERVEVWDSAANLFRHEERQQYETTYQFSAWIPQDVPDVVSLTESDILNVVSGILQSDATMGAFRAAGAGVLRITDVRNPYIVDDRGLFEAVPSFDIVITHRRTRLATTPALVSYDVVFRRI